MSKHITYNHCGICGRVPKSDQEEPNWAPVRWWDPDDGWRIGSLCRWCIDEVGDRQPRPTDYAYQDCDEFCPEENINTDEDPSEVIE